MNPTPRYMTRFLLGSAVRPEKVNTMIIAFLSLDRRFQKWFGTLNWLRVIFDPLTYRWRSNAARRRPDSFACSNQESTAVSNSGSRGIR